MKDSDSLSKTVVGWLDACYSKNGEVYPSLKFPNVASCWFVGIYAGRIWAIRWQPVTVILHEEYGLWKEKKNPNMQHIENASATYMMMY